MSGEKYYIIAKQLNKALYLQQRRWGRGLGRLDRVHTIRILSTWYADGVIDAHGQRYDEAVRLILGDADDARCIIPELRSMINTLPKAIRSQDWVGVDNGGVADDGITDEDRVSQELEGHVDLYGYIKYLHTLSY